MENRKFLEKIKNLHYSHKKSRPKAGFFVFIVIIIFLLSCLRSFRFGEFLIDGGLNAQYCGNKEECQQYH